MNSVRLPDRWSRLAPAKLNAAAPTAATVVASAGTINQRARPANVPTSRPAPNTTVAHPKACAPRLLSLPASHTSAPTTVAAPIASNPSADRGGRGRSRRCVVHDSQRSLVDPPSAVASISGAGFADRSSSGARPRHSATAIPRRPMATTQPAAGSRALPLNNHRAASRMTTLPAIRRKVDEGGDEGESASSSNAAM